MEVLRLLYIQNKELKMTYLSTDARTDLANLLLELCRNFPNLRMDVHACNLLAITSLRNTTVRALATKSTASRDKVTNLLYDTTQYMCTPCRVVLLFTQHWTIVRLTVEQQQHAYSSTAAQ